MNKQAEEELEFLFEKASEEPAFRAEFLSQLLESNIYIAGTTGHSQSNQTEELYLQENEEVQIKSWPNDEYGRIIPFFSSLDKMRLALGEDERFICISCKVFFKMTEGALLILNPESKYHKPFYPEEIQRLIYGENESVQPYNLEEDTQVMLGQPKVLPEFMFDQLAKVFQTYEAVHSAYFAQMYNPETDEQPSYIIGLLFDDLIEQITIEKLHQQVAQVAHDSLEENVGVSLLHIDRQEENGISAYFLNDVQAFYLRPSAKKKGFFAKLFS